MKVQALGVVVLSVAGLALAAAIAESPKPTSPQQSTMTSQQRCVQLNELAGHVADLSKRFDTAKTEQEKELLLKEHGALMSKVDAVSGKVDLSCVDDCTRDQTNCAVICRDKNGSAECYRWCVARYELCFRGCDMEIFTGPLIKSNP
jgi:hypothetical protein